MKFVCDKIHYNFLTACLTPIHINVFIHAFVYIQVYEYMYVYICIYIYMYMQGVETSSAPSTPTVGFTNRVPKRCCLVFLFSNLSLRMAACKSSPFIPRDVAISSNCNAWSMIRIWRGPRRVHKRRRVCNRRHPGRSRWALHSTPRALLDTIQIPSASGASPCEHQEDVPRERKYRWHR